MAILTDFIKKFRSPHKEDDVNRFNSNILSTLQNTPISELQKLLTIAQSTSSGHTTNIPMNGFLGVTIKPRVAIFYLVPGFFRSNSKKYEMPIAAFKMLINEVLQQQTLAAEIIKRKSEEKLRTLENVSAQDLNAILLNVLSSLPNDYLNHVKDFGSSSKATSELSTNTILEKFDLGLEYSSALYELLKSRHDQQTDNAASTNISRILMLLDNQAKFYYEEDIRGDYDQGVNTYHYEIDSSRKQTFVESALELFRAAQNSSDQSLKNEVFTRLHQAAIICATDNNPELLKIYLAAYNLLTANNTDFTDPQLRTHIKSLSAGLRLANATNPPADIKQKLDTAISTLARLELELKQDPRTASEKALDILRERQAKLDSIIPLLPQSFTEMRDINCTVSHTMICNPLRYNKTNPWYEEVDYRTWINEKTTDPINRDTVEEKNLMTNPPYTMLIDHLLKYTEGTDFKEHLKECKIQFENTDGSKYEKALTECDIPFISKKTSKSYEFGSKAYEAHNERYPGDLEKNTLMTAVIRYVIDAGPDKHAQKSMRI